MIQIPPWLLGETEWPDASDLLMHLPIQLAYEGVPATNIATNTAYGDFNGTDNYIDCGFKPADITVDNPFELVLKHVITGATERVCAVSDGTNVFGVYNQPNGDIKIYRMAGTNYVLFTIAQIASYSGGVIKAIYQPEDGGVNVAISLYGYDGIVDGVETWTQIGSTNTQAIAGIPDYNIYVGCLNNIGTTFGFANLQIRQLTGNGQTWYFNPASSNTIKSTDGTSLTVQGDTTDFFRGTPTVDPAGWSKDIATGIRRFKVLYNPDLDAINLELDELFWDDATKTPKIIDHTTIGSNYLGKNLLFQCITGEPYSNLILFATPRTSSTTPSIEQVAAYLQLTPGDIVTFNGVEFTFGGRPVRF